MDTPAEGSAAQSRTAGNLTYVLLAAVVAIAAIFAFNATALPDHWYAVFKTVHVLFAVAWIGGGVLITILGLRAQRESDPAAVVGVARQAALPARRSSRPPGSSSS